MAKPYRPPGMDPPPKAERLGSPALYAQKRRMSEIGRAEMEREATPKRTKRKSSVAPPSAAMSAKGKRKTTGKRVAGK